MTNKAGIQVNRTDKIYYAIIKGGHPDLNRELTVPHTVVLPFELYPPLDLYNILRLCWSDSNTQ